MASAKLVASDIYGRHEGSRDCNWRCKPESCGIGPTVATLVANLGAQTATAGLRRTCQNGLKRGENPQTPEVQNRGPCSPALTMVRHIKPDLVWELRGETCVPIRLIGLCQTALIRPPPGTLGGGHHA